MEEDMYEQLYVFPSKHKNNIVIQMSPGCSLLYIKYNFTGRRKKKKKKVCVFQFFSFNLFTLYVYWKKIRHIQGWICQSYLSQATYNRIAPGEPGDRSRKSNQLVLLFYHFWI